MHRASGSHSGYRESDPYHAAAHTAGSRNQRPSYRYHRTRANFTTRNNTAIRANFTTRNNTATFANY